ncbi:hypothetical protein L6164_023738 [Bauhinia variegata]|uniref:Uncharacterized protein n=1 Tax=Bauhinia variegata TaxID=167791 RepID=A0ACB9MMR4_BAUVA|nr:hypothetical protein L6164_023738 [Bauhinia variegata]
MALYQLCLLPNLGDSTILQTGQAKSSSLLKTKCSYILRPIQRMAPTVSAHAIPRRSTNFGSSVWDYDFIQSLTSEFVDNELYAEQRNHLKEEVRIMLCKMKNPLFQLVLIDDLLRLGLAYHFNNDINTILDNVYKNMDSFMEENLYFTALKFRLSRQNGYHISAVTHALEIPLHWRMLRLEARWFIDFYGRKKSMIHSLLKLAKLDFNMVQTIHQEDLKHASSHKFGYFRRIMTKVNALITIIDDVYDVYDTLEELELFTDVVGKWDMNAMDTLPEYMKICFLELYNFVDEFARDTLKEKGHQIHPYLGKLREMETGDIPKLIQCYMHETGASEAYAREHIKSIICTTWKKINEDVNSGSYPLSFIEIAVNFARMSICMYQYGDAHSIQDQESKKWISSLLFEAIPIA